MRNRTQPWDDDLRSQTYIHAWRHTYMLRHLRHTYMLTGLRHTYTLSDFKHTCMLGCFKHTYIHTTHPSNARLKVSNIHAYEVPTYTLSELKHTRLASSNIHTCSAHIFIFWNMRFWACMFERVCLIFDDRQRVFKHTYMLIRWLLIAFMADFA